MASRIPPLLDTYLYLPPETSLVLLNGVLGSTTNWLVLRYLYSLFSTTSDPVANQPGLGSPTRGVASVVLVSFLRDYAFWKDGAGKLGMDLDALNGTGTFVFLDGLAGLFHAPQRHNPIGEKILSSPTLQHLHKELEDAVAQVQTSAPGMRTVLVVDQVDLLLAASGGAVPSQGLREMLLDIREKVHSSIITISADEPLVSLQTTSLEKEHAALAISLSHDADLMISLRMLDSGTARDVSGVIRATPGGGNNNFDRAVEERELLYFVTGDGGVRVFERG
ncbi:hypothetical protein GGR54DRAFT_630719 [Hypoxylon sp. NC1633]|nr:hypothetical protein GGR54DRAFT_630719 [Hypoxylon sp. NC1633]